jgi:hypothetical protein
MEEGKLMLLTQLVNTIESNFNALEKAYDNSDKEKFDLSSSAILELSSKINSVLKTK